MKTKDYVSILLVVLSAVAAAWLPALGYVFTVLGAAVCGLLYTRRGWYPVTVSAVLGFAAAFAVARNPLTAVLLVVGIVLPGCVMMVCWKKGLGMKEIVVAGTISLLAQTLLEFGIVQLQTGQNLFSEAIAGLQAEVDNMMPQFQQMLEQAGTSNVEENMQALNELAHSTVELTAQLIPAILFIFCCIAAYLILCICREVLRREGKNVKKILPFTELYAPRTMVLAVVAAFLISLLVSQQAVRGAAINITIVLFCYFIVCGISLLCFFMKYWFPRVLLRVLIAIPMVMVLLSLMAMPIVNPLQLFLLAGVLDSAFQFRRRVRHVDVL